MPTTRQALIAEDATRFGRDVARDHRRTGIGQQDYPLSGEWADHVTATDVYASAARAVGITVEELYSDECDLAADTFEAAYASVFTA